MVSPVPGSARASKAPRTNRIKENNKNSGRIARGYSPLSVSKKETTKPKKQQHKFDILAKCVREEDEMPCGKVVLSMTPRQVALYNKLNPKRQLVICNRSKLTQ